MGISYRCDTRTGLAVEVWGGAVTAAEAQRHVEQLAADPNWAASRRLVTDLTSISTESRPDAEQIARLGDVFLQQLGYLVGDVKWAVIAHHTFDEALGFGAHVRHEVRRMIVFTNLVGACVWLGLDPADVRPAIDDLRAKLRAQPTPGA